LEVASRWLNNANHPKKTSSGDFDELQEASASLQSALDDFQKGRLQILMPFRHLFDPNHPPVDLTNKVSNCRLIVADRQMSYRGLFQNFVAEYHVVSPSLVVFLMIDGIRPNTVAPPALIGAVGNLSDASAILVPHAKSLVASFQGVR
jgi:hypothetical protein